MNMLKKYIARKPEVDVVHTSNKDDVTIAVAGVIYQDTDPELGEVPHFRKKGFEMSNYLKIYVKTSNIYAEGLDSKVP